MDLLLDTCVFLWWQAGKIKPNSRFFEIISNGDNKVVISAATIWEIGIKKKKGKLRFDRSPKIAVMENSFDLLEITADHAEKAADLPLHHADPFDRMLIAQALEEGLILVTMDDEIAHYNVPQFRET